VTSAMSPNCSRLMVCWQPGRTGRSRRADREMRHEAGRLQNRRSVALRIQLSSRSHAMISGHTWACARGPTRSARC
jgi:hypothetical protein